MMKSDSLRRLRLLALLEASTLAILLFIAVPLKHLAGLPAAVSVMGPAHGAVFVLYLCALAGNTSNGMLRPRLAWQLAAAACVPLMGFISGRRISKQGTQR